MSEERGNLIVSDPWRPLEPGSTATGVIIGSSDVTMTGGRSWTCAFPVLKPACVVTVLVGAEDDGMTAARQVAVALGPLLLSCDALEIAAPMGNLPNLRLTSISQSDVLLVDAGRFVALTKSQPHGDHARPGSNRITVDSPVGPQVGPQPAPAAHVRLARDLRDLTGLPAATLGAALGVTREQYQRWLRGAPISTIRHGQLNYLHTIAAEAVRRMGVEAARVWWRTPGADGATPEQQVRDRLTDRVHRLVSDLPDAAPVVNNVLVALPAQQPLDLDDVKDGCDDDAGSWSPYGEAGPPQV